MSLSLIGVCSTGKIDCALPTWWWGSYKTEIFTLGIVTNKKTGERPGPVSGSGGGKVLFLVPAQGDGHDMVSGRGARNAAKITHVDVRVIVGQAKRHGP